MFKKIGIAIVLLVVFVVMLVFTRMNPGEVRLDLAFGVVETSIPLAFSVTFVLGSAFGVGCTGLLLLRLANERRRLRRRLESTESEVSRLRNLPLADAD